MRCARSCNNYTETCLVLVPTACVRSGYCFFFKLEIRYVGANFTVLDHGCFAGGRGFYLPIWPTFVLVTQLLAEFDVCACVLNVFADPRLLTGVYLSWLLNFTFARTIVLDAAGVCSNVWNCKNTMILWELSNSPVIFANIVKQ